MSLTLNRLLAGITLLASFPVLAEIKWLAEGEIAATAHDQSRLGGMLEDGATPRDRVGGLGGALAYSGHGQVFYAVPDRGPGAGETTFEERLYQLDLGLRHEGGTYRLEPRITATHILRDAASHPLTGDAAAYDAVNSNVSRRRNGIVSLQWKRSQSSAIVGARELPWLQCSSTLSPLARALSIVSSALVMISSRM